MARTQTKKELNVMYFIFIRQIVNKNLVFYLPKYFYISNIDRILGYFVFI